MEDPRVKCLLCSRLGSRATFKVITLTPAERELVTNPLDEYPYCKQCWNLLSDPAHSPAIISGVARMHLANAGVRDIDSRISKFRNALATKATGRRN